MKRMKNFLSFLLVILLVFTNYNVDAAAAGVQTGTYSKQDQTNQQEIKKVTKSTKVKLRIEYADTTMFEETEVTVPEGASFSGYGLAGFSETDYATPLHALAQLFMNNGATKENILDYVGVTSSQFGAFLATIDKDGNGSNYESSGGIYSTDKGLTWAEYGWMYAVNDIMGGVGIDAFKLSANDSIVLYASHFAFSGSYTSYYANFKKTSYSCAAKETLELQLLGENAFAYPAVGINEPIGDARVYIYDENGVTIDDLYEAIVEEPYPYEYKTNADGKVNIDLAPIYELLESIYAEGTYTLTASAEKKDSNDMMLSRAKATIKLTENLDGVWSSFRGNDTNNGITQAATPITAADRWAFKLKQSSEWDKNVSDPIIAGNYTYIIVDNKLLKLDENGNELNQTTLAGGINSVSRMVYVDGIIYIPLASGQIQAVDSITLESLWKTAPIEKMQSISTMIYRDGYLYTTITEADSASATNGKLICIDVTDEDPETSDEIKDLKWTVDNTEAGYYWAGPVIVNNNLIIGDDAGNLSSYDLDGIKIDSKKVSSKIRATVAADGNDIYFSDYKGNLNKATVNADGTLSEVKSVNFGAGSTSTPAVYNGRAYVGGFSTTYKGVLAVIDTATMKVIYKVETPAVVQSSPLVSTAYATPANNQTIYVYFTSNVAPGGIYCLKDSKTSVNGQAQQIYLPKTENQQYCMASISADRNGNLYYTNDSGSLFCIGKGIAIEKITVTGLQSTMKIGETIKVAPQITPADATNQKLTVKSGDSKIASVTDNGNGSYQIKALAEGKVKLTFAAADGSNVKTEYNVTIIKGSIVIVPDVPTKKVNVSVEGLAANQSKKTLNLAKGKSVKVKGTVSPVTAKQGVTYRSNKPSVVSVTKGGIIKGLKIGNATITIKSADSKKSVNLKVKVSKKARAVKTIRATKSKIIVKAKHTAQIKINVAPKTTTQYITYKLKKTSIATVSKTGLITAKKKGTTDITVKCGKKTLKIKVIVK